MSGTKELLRKKKKAAEWEEQKRKREGGGSGKDRESKEGKKSPCYQEVSCLLGAPGASERWERILRHSELPA